MVSFIWEAGSQGIRGKEMFEKVLYVTSIYNDSRVRSQVMEQLKSSGTGKCLIVQCIQSRDIIYDFPQFNEHFEEILAAKKEETERMGFETEGFSIMDNLVAKINRLAREKECSLIALGVLRTSLAREMFLTDITSFVAQNTEKPVLIVPVEKTPGGFLGELADMVIEGTIRRLMKISPEKSNGKTSLYPSHRKWEMKKHVLFTTDFSVNSGIAFHLLKELALTGVERITLFHVQDKKKIGQDFRSKIDEYNRIDQERLAKMSMEIEGAGRVESKITSGSPYEEIIQFARKEKASLIIMGSQGRGYMKEIFIGSISHRMARSSVIPLILVPFKSGRSVNRAQEA